MSRTIHHAWMRYKLSSHMHWSPELHHASLSGSAWKSPMQSMWCPFALICTRVGKTKTPPEPNGVFPVRTCLKCAPCEKGQLQTLSSPKSPDAWRVHVWKRLIFNERNQPAVSITCYSHLHPKTVLLTVQNSSCFVVLAYLSGLKPSSSSRKMLLLVTVLSWLGMMRNLRMVPLLEPRKRTVRFL